MCLSEYLGNACKILQVGQRAVWSICRPLHGRRERSLPLQSGQSQQHSSSVAIRNSKPNPLLTTSTILDCSHLNPCWSGCSQCVPAARVCNLPGIPGHIPKTKLLIQLYVEQQPLAKTGTRMAFLFPSPLCWWCSTLFKFDVGFRIAAARFVRGFSTMSAGC